MLKKLQALKAKKGFTLVELIVVIAIIAVLAAILVPTLMGQVTKSRITSANSGAATLKDNLNTWFMNRDAAGNKLLKGNNTSCATEGFCDSSFTIKAGAGGIASGGISMTFTGETYTPTLIDYLNENLPLRNVYAEVFMKNGKAVAVAYYEGSADGPCSTGTTLTNQWPTAAQFKAGTKTWKGSQDGEVGITTDGFVIGTFPKLGHSATTTPSA